MAIEFKGKKLKCPKCGSVKLIKNGRGGKAGRPQYRCSLCGRNTVKPRGLNR